MWKSLLLIGFLLQGCATLGNTPGDLFYTSTVANNPLVAVQKILEETNNPVTLAIVVRSIINPTLAQQDQAYFKEWTKGIEAELISNWEQQFLDRCGKYEGFRLTDRNSTEKVIHEFNFQLQGYTREVDASKIGQFLNVNHLLVINFSRYYKGTSFLFGPVFTDAIQVRLIKIEDASVVSVYTTQRKSR